MAAGAWTPTNTTRLKILNGQFDWDTDTFKVALLLSTSNISATSTTHAGVTNEHANANGYTTGGIAQAFTLVQVGGGGNPNVEVRFTANPVWTASGGSIVARFAEIYEVGGDVCFFCLLDSTPADVTATTGNTLTIDSDGTPSPVFTLA
jgi:hypothetical protein